MFFINLSKPESILISLFLVMCFMYLGKQAKNAYIPLMPLVTFLLLLVVHSIQILTLSPANEIYRVALGWSLAFDFAFILLGYLAYMWTDEVETVSKKKKSVDNSLAAFWKNV